MESTKHLLELIEFGKSVGFEVNIQLLFLSLYASNKQSEIEIITITPFIVASRNIKYLGINLTKLCKTCTPMTMKY